MTQLLMPKATAVWLVENTGLSFEQIAEFCGMHALEVQGIADGEVAIGIVGQDPVATGQLTREEIERCEQDPSARLQMEKTELPLTVPKRKGARYTPVSKRQDRPDAISWLVRHHAELKDAQISTLVGTTKATIAAVRNRTHWNNANIKPQSPVALGLCTQEELEVAIAKARRSPSRAAKKAARLGPAAAAPVTPVEEMPAEPDAETAE